ncbi:hypothetical protein ACIA5C_36130 [Actinoplanes sp. NPDC051343]|uniref:hypothetical protein n=1 Tax=Actinoplanes sp. NPDC051343 TaxID=3363906 RepID=UPI0037A449D3
MSMLQLLGGVAVAGAVAAGTTAFTAGGLSTNLVNSDARDNGWLGGSQSVTVLGATLDKLDFTPGSTGTGVSLATLTFDTTSLPTTATVTISTGTTLHSASAANGFYCSSINTGTGVATCAVSSASTTVAEAGSYYPNPTSVTITVS